MQPVRRQVELGPTSSSCGLCGHRGQVLVRSFRVRHGVALINPWFDSNTRTYELCPSCGAKREVEDRAAARAS